MAVLVTIADILTAVHDVLTAIPPVLPAVEAVFDPVAEAAIVHRVAAILATVPNVFGAVPPIFTPIAHVFRTVPPVLLPVPDILHTVATDVGPGSRLCEDRRAGHDEQRGCDSQNSIPVHDSSTRVRLRSTRHRALCLPDPCGPRSVKTLNESAGAGVLRCSRSRTEERKTAEGDPTPRRLRKARTSFRYCTITVARMNGCGTQKYGNVPACVNV